MTGLNKKNKSQRTWVTSATNNVPSLDLVCHLQEFFLRRVLPATHFSVVMSNHSFHKKVVSLGYQKQKKFKNWCHYFTAILPHLTYCNSANVILDVSVADIFQTEWVVLSSMCPVQIYCSYINGAYYSSIKLPCRKVHSTHKSSNQNNQLQLTSSV